MLARRKEWLDQLEEEIGARTVGIRGTSPTTTGSRRPSTKPRSLGALDGVIAVAGKSMAGSIATGTPQRWRELIDLNLVGPLATVRYALAHFPPTGRRDVVLVGSAGAIVAMPGTGIYGASKRGLRAAFDTLRLELAPSGVNASFVMPGFFQTEGLTLEGVVIDGDVPENDFPMLVEEAVLPLPTRSETPSRS